MINPVTSTNVATKGAELTAGSAPNFFKIIGSILPQREPHKTTPNKVTATVIPISSQCEPYNWGLMACHAKILKKPMTPSTHPNNRPERISLLKTRHQSSSVISPTAIAWMINVQACEPLLPPLEIINGIKST